MVFLRSTAVSQLGIVGGEREAADITHCHDWGGPSFRRMSLLNVLPITVFEKQTDADPAALCTSFEAFKGLTSKHMSYFNYIILVHER